MTKIAKNSVKKGTFNKLYGQQSTWMPLINSDQNKMKDLYSTTGNQEQAYLAAKKAEKQIILVNYLHYIQVTRARIKTILLHPCSTK
jgi:hypothetical protein